MQYIKTVLLIKCSLSLKILSILLRTIYELCFPYHCAKMSLTALLIFKAQPMSNYI